VPNAADILNNTVLKFDVTTSTGVQFVPIFLTNTGATYYQSPSGFYIGASGLPQTVSYDYSGLGLPLDATTIRIRLQLSDGSPVSFYLDNVRVSGAIVQPGGTGTWSHNGSGAWTDAANWDDANAGEFPGAPGSQVFLDSHGGSVSTSSQIVITLDQPVNPANITFDKGGGGYKIAGTSPITVAANVNVNSGSHVISSPLTVNAGSQFNIAGGSSLTVDNLTVNGFNVVVKTGDGTLTTDKVNGTSVDVQGGIWNLKPGNLQNNGFIFDLKLENGSTFNMNGAHVRTNSLNTAGTPGVIDLGTGGVLSTGFFGGYTFFGSINGAGSVVVGGEDTSPHVVGFAGSNSYSGTTTVTNGNTLQIGSAVNLGDESATNSVILNNGILQATADFTTTRQVNIATTGTVDTNGFSVGVGAVNSGSLTKSGSGVLTVGRLNAVSSVSVNSGALKLAPNGTAAGASKIGNLTLADGTSLDVTNNQMIISGSNLPAIQTAVIAGYATGAWNGSGIVSSSAAADAAHKTAVGYASASELGLGSFAGQPVLGTDVLLRFTFSGDMNLDGRVNALDFNSLATNFGASGKDWASGDFNYDTVVNTLDFTALATNFGSSLAAPALGTLVPEPTQILAGSFAIALMSRRRRSS
jgi:hypothetical protein